MGSAVALSVAVVLLSEAYTESGPTAEVQTTARPNIIFILTDDLDAHPKSISRMPNLRRYLINNGTTFVMRS
jgi:N-acetylglucosamine-6-sulfatase